ncbi:10236_t:CDS:2, partial [Gigaspora margarita]
YSSQLVDKNHAFEIEDIVESFNTGFAEDNINVPLILLKELIPTNRFDNIVKIWELFRHRCTKKNYIVLFNNQSYLCTCLGLVRYSFQAFTNGFQESSEATLNIEIKEYVVANGLFKKVIQMELDAGPSAIQETLLAIFQNIQDHDSDNFDNFNNSDDSNDLGDSNNL